MPIFLTAKQAAEILGCPVGHVYYLVAYSRIDAFHIRSLVRIDRFSLEDYAKRNHRNSKKRSLSSFGKRDCQPVAML